MTCALLACSRRPLPQSPAHSGRCPPTRPMDPYASQLQAMGSEHEISHHEAAVAHTACPLPGNRHHQHNRSSVKRTCSIRRKQCTRTTENKTCGRFLCNLCTLLAYRRHPKRDRLPSALKARVPELQQGSGPPAPRRSQRPRLPCIAPVSLPNNHPGLFTRTDPAAPYAVLASPLTEST